MEGAGTAHLRLNPARLDGVEASTPGGASASPLVAAGLRTFFGGTTTSASASTVPKERRREGTGEGARPELQEQQSAPINEVS